MLTAKILLLWTLKFLIRTKWDSTLVDVYAQVNYWRKLYLSLVVRVLLNLLNINSTFQNLIIKPCTLCFNIFQ